MVFIMHQIVFYSFFFCEETDWLSKARITVVAKMSTAPNISAQLSCRPMKRNPRTTAVKGSKVFRTVASVAVMYFKLVTKIT